MEAFSLLKYWRGGGLVASSAPPNGPNNVTSAAATILTAVAENSDESHETDDDDDDDDGPFFDLEFAVPDEAEAHEASGSSDSGDESEVEVHQDGEDDESDDDDDVDVDVDGEEGEFNFTVSSGSSNDRTDPNLSMSPSDDLFFKGKLVPIEPSSIVFNPSEPNSKAQFAGSLLKSATKFRVFMSGLKKSKSNSNGPENKTEPTNTNGSVQEQHEKQENKQQKQGKLFTVKLKVEEVPIVSLFTRDNSSRISTKTQNQKTQSSEEAASEEKRFSKEVMQKYLKMVKPLYVRVSKRYGEKTRLSGQLSVSSPQPAEKSQAEAEVSEPAASNVKSTLKQGNIPAGLRVVCKHLGKSRSASSAVAAAPPGTVPSQRRDDSLLQQQDGIQSAILHCKRSFNASRDSDSTPLSRSMSDSCNEKASLKPSDQGGEV